MELDNQSSTDKESEIPDLCILPAWQAGRADGDNQIIEDVKFDIVLALI